MIFNLAGTKAHPVHALLASIAVLAAALHLAFLSLFLRSDVPTLTTLNIASVASHILTLFLINRSHELKGLMLVVAEVAIHAVIAT